MCFVNHYRRARGVMNKYQGGVCARARVCVCVCVCHIIRFEVLKYSEHGLWTRSGQDCM